jgi:2-polyprenyl-3-methyl-5-hydroxy-6-metoxy-1,4-benzoquinol methylase
MSHHHEHEHDEHQHEDAIPTASVDFWEDRYASADQIWSGKVNHALVQVVSDLTPGRALDLGCGEGGDAIWLAQQGWHATGVDISETAVGRASAAARKAGLDDKVQFVAANLATWTSEDMYELVTASFLQSPVELPRVDILRRVAQQVVPGGRLLVVAHAAMPPWSRAGNHHHEFVSPSDEVAALGLDGWTTEIAEVRSREATGPDGEQATLDDTVVLLRR